MSNEHLTSGNLFWLMSPNFKKLVPTATSLWDAELVNRWSTHVWFPREAWRKRGCFAGDTVSDLFRIQSTLNKHGYHSILQPYAIPSGLRLVWLSFVFNRTMTQHTSRLCKGYLTKKESDGVLHQMTWTPESPDLNPNDMVWNELDRRVKEKQPTSAQHLCELLQDCWKSIPGEAGWENTKSVQSCH